MEVGLLKLSRVPSHSPAPHPYTQPCPYPYPYPSPRYSLLGRLGTPTEGFLPRFLRDLLLRKDAAGAAPSVELQVMEG